MELNVGVEIWMGHSRRIEWRNVPSCSSNRKNCPVVVVCPVGSGLDIHAPVTLLPRDSRNFTFDSGRLTAADP